MIREAADTDHQRIAWTSGKTQAGRYNLSKQVDEIVYQGSGDETSVILKGVKGISDQDLELVLDGDGVVLVVDHGAPDNWKGKHISDVVGKDVGQKIMSGSGDYKRYKQLFINIHINHLNQINIILIIIKLI